jgi:hypothetical protein
MDPQTLAATFIAGRDSANPTLGLLYRHYLRSDFHRRFPGNPFYLFSILMSRPLLKIFSFFSICGAIAIALHFMIGRGLTNIKTSDLGAFNRAMLGLVNADIVISGSSRAYVHYDPSIISQITGKKTFNLARDGSHTDLQLAVLKAYLKHNKKPGLIIQNLDMHTFVPTPKDEIPKPTQYMPYLNEPEIYDMLLGINPGVWKWKRVPLYGYVVEDVNFGWLQGFKGLLGRNSREDHIEGYFPADRQWNSDFDRFKMKHPNGVGFRVDPRGVQMVEELVSICKTNGIQLALVYSPQYFEMLDLVTNRAEVFAAFREISERTGTPFWDYTQASYCRDKKYFYNSQHLNRTGAEIFSRELSLRLVKGRRSASSVLD